MKAAYCGNKFSFFDSVHEIKNRKNIEQRYFIINFSNFWNKFYLRGTENTEVYTKKSFAFCKASSIPAGFFPPAVAKKACPPPPPWMYFPSSRINFPASKFFSTAN